jgi:hypothetical protein
VRSASLRLAVVAVTIATVALASPAQARVDQPASAARTLWRAGILRHASNYVKETRALHRLMGRMRPGRFYALDRAHPERTHAVWSGRLTRARRAVHRPPHRAAWLCIHRYEGSWTDPGAPYYGGLQMDWGFMRTYGGWLLARRGTANRWSAPAQMWVAEQALQRGRGFYPWPNSARMCGLI